tara:strand:+ start:240 stop:878 length:639 start_codon:yes stop_codon:yes gene_type:complete
MFKSIKRYLKSANGNTLAEFAVTTAMMATLATTAAPKFSGVGEGAKEKKTLADIDKIVKSANNFYNTKVTEEGRGRFPGQIKYDEQIGGYALDTLLQQGVASFTSYDDAEGSNWVSVFGTTTKNAAGEDLIPSGHNISVAEDDDKDGSFDVYSGAEEFLAEFGGNPIGSPFQDGHYIYAVIPGGGSGASSYSPILYVADLENPSNFNKKLQP